MYDSSNLVSGAVELPFTTGSQETGATAHPENTTIDVNWVGGDCKRTPVIHVDGSAQALSIRVEPDATDQLPLPYACDAVGVLLGITLQTTVPVDQSAITYTDK